MIDRDKVISRLQIVRTWAEVGKNYNGIQGEGCLRDVVDWIDDALVLLKEQEPRVLTYEEADAIAHQTEETAIYLERKSHKSLYAAIAGDTQGRVPNISWLGEKRNYPIEYGKTWRCWSAKPTDEQRRVVPWNT